MERAALVPQERWAALDYLRGLMALSILVFHFDKWTSGHWDAASIQGKLGVYGVSVFFVLSGMALTSTYQQKMKADWRSMAAFAIKRGFRILPLLWVATGITLLLDDVPRSLGVVLLNFSGLFGFVDPSKDIATGAWSIGSELVYYALFPAMLLETRRKKWLIWILTGLFGGFSFYRAFMWPFWPNASEQAEWWPYYVQAPLHAFFFVAGMALATYRRYFETWSPKIWRLLLGMSAALFVGIDVGADPQILVAGNTRIIFSACAVLATAAWSFGVNVSGAGAGVLAWLGSISYALYLLHPLVFRAVKAAITRSGSMSEVLLLPLAFGISLIASHVVYRLLEKPCMRFGSKLVRRLAIE